MFPAQKNALSNCHGCKRLHTAPIPNPTPENLRKERTGGATPFKIVGVGLCWSYLLSQQEE